ncbi:hypothetical protein Q767_06320 [Flavobacterium enshiense DK69]|uniref:Uncharacterized protein n=1 Tax=Flavobacterium enshiense DK69 TaxID=1107311 RepID=A0A0A2MY07_9FLAO|nr:hypothetical protein Q767_06320 [Flavobacterium enshiense DK69]
MPAAKPENIPVVLVYVVPSILYVIPTPVGEVNVIVPVVVLQLGCVTEPAGVVGVDGCGLTVTLVAVEIHPAALFTVTLYGPGFTLVKVVELWYVLPLMLYVKPDPVGLLIAIVPFDIVQDGCVTVTVGWVGILLTIMVMAFLGVVMNPKVVASA